MRQALSSLTGTVGEEAVLELLGTSGQTGGGGWRAGSSGWWRVSRVGCGVREGGCGICEGQLPEVVEGVAIVAVAAVH